MTRQAIVTGTSRGIGAAVAHALLERGWHVLGVARGAAPADLETDGYEHVRLDLSDLEATVAFFEGPLLERVGFATLDRLGLVNNAALLAPVAPVHELGAPELARTFVVNAVTPLWLMGFLLRAAPRAALRIVNLSSGAAHSPYPGWAAYCSTKAALNMSGSVLATEAEEVEALKDRDLAIVEYAPHVVATRMQEELRAVEPSRFPRRERFVELHETGALVAPEGPAAEIADLLDADDLPVHQERRYEPR